VPHFLTHYDSEELGILRVRPGLTGPGQIFYTEVQEAEENTVTDPEARYVGFQLHPKLAIDLDYLRRRSFWLDLTIVARTVALISGLGKPVHVHLTSADALPMNAATQDGALP
jgi:lipopolysaccharide/colanic/teichoic acid biosynthesis glycosyltransferase